MFYWLGTQRILYPSIDHKGSSLTGAIDEMKVRQETAIDGKDIDVLHVLQETAIDGKEIDVLHVLQETDINSEDMHWDPAIDILDIYKKPPEYAIDMHITQRCDWRTYLGGDSLFGGRGVPSPSDWATS